MNAVSSGTRKNPDTSYGLHNTAEIRAEARVVRNAREKKQLLDLNKAKERDIKAGELTKKKKEAYDRVVGTIKESLPDATDLKKHLLRLKLDELKLAYQHLGGMVKDLSDQKKDTIANALSETEEILSVLNRKTSSNDSNNNMEMSLDETNTNRNEESVECNDDASVECDVENHEVSKNKMMDFFMFRN